MRHTALTILGDRVLLRPDEAESTSSGIYLPESAQEKPQTAVVVAVGPGKQLANGTLIPIGLCEGDHVMFAKYGGTEIDVDGETLTIIDADMVQGKLVESD